MKPTLKLIKNNLFTILVLFVFIIGMFFMSYIKKMYWDNNNEAAYGTRIAGIENHEISGSEQKETEERIMENKKVTNADIEINGRIISVIVTIDKSMSKKDAKSLGDEILKNFDKDQLSYYSVQIYLNKEDKSSNDFPIIGYKHYSNDKLSWTKDREVTK